MTEQLNAAAIKQALASRGWSQRQLAKALGLSPQTVTNWMKGADFPRPAALLKLKRALDLSLGDLVSNSAPEPVVAFRRKAATKTTLEHVSKAKRMGFLLQPLVSHLEHLVSEQTIFRSVSTDYEAIQQLASLRREALKIPPNGEVSYANLVNGLAGNGALIVPVHWGKTQRHENAVHILLPVENITFVYLNLDARVDDFKFWMAHELGHSFTPSLCGTDDGEDFADAFAAAFLFPRALAKETWKQCKGMDSQNCLKVLKEAAAKHEVSLFTVYNQVNAYCTNEKLGILPMDAKTIHMVRNGSAMQTVAERIWGSKPPTPKKYMDEAEQVFRTPFFKALKDLLRSGKGGEGYVQQVLDATKPDALALYSALIH